MNLLLLPEGTSNEELEVTGRQAKHIRRVLRSKPGDIIRVGVENGLLGTATVLDVQENSARIQVSAHEPPPVGLPIRVIIGLPRPKMLRRIIQMLTSTGVKDIIFTHSYRVEKSYWMSPFLEPESILEQARLGLEQGRDTILPSIQLKRYFRPFAEDELPSLVKNQRAFVAHPGDFPLCPGPSKEPTTLVVGPEGGFIPWEVDFLQKSGCTPVSFGSRILRVETAIPMLLGRIAPIC